MQTIIVVLDSKKLENPDLDIRYELPDQVERYTHNEIMDNGYDYLTDTKLGIWMATERASQSYSKIVQFFEQHMVCGNDLTGTAKVYISEEEAAPFEECTLVYDGEKMVPEEAVRVNNRAQKVGNIFLKIAGIITNNDEIVTTQLKNKLNDFQDTEQQLDCFTKTLKASKYLCECDEDITCAEFLNVLKETVTVKANELQVRNNHFDEDDDWYEWCEALDEQWEDKGYCMAVYKPENESEVVFPCSIEKLEEISEEAKEICIRIVAVAEY